MDLCISPINQTRSDLAKKSCRIGSGYNNSHILEKTKRINAARLDDCYKNGSENIVMALYSKK